MHRRLVLNETVFTIPVIRESGGHVTITHQIISIILIFWDKMVGNFGQDVSSLSSCFATCLFAFSQLLK